MFPGPCELEAVAAAPVRLCVGLCLCSVGEVFDGDGKGVVCTCTALYRVGDRCSIAFSLRGLVTIGITGQVCVKVCRGNGVLDDDVGDVRTCASITMLSVLPLCAYDFDDNLPWCSTGLDGAVIGCTTEVGMMGEGAGGVCTLE